MTIIYMASHTPSRKSLARKALYFARRRTDRSLTTLHTSARENVWNALKSHRSSLHTSTADGAVVAQLQFYADLVDLVASTSRSSLSAELDSMTRGSTVLPLVDVYSSLVDCVGYLGAEQAACTAILPAKQTPHAVCDHVGNRETLLYAQAAFSAEICFRTLGRQAVTAAAKSKVLTAVRLYNNDNGGLEACRRRLLPDFGAVKRAQTPSAADVWKCGRARRLRQLRRLQLNMNKSISDEADYILCQVERDIVASWTDERHAASWRLTITVIALSTSITYLLIGYACHCRIVLHHSRCNTMTRPPSSHSAVANNEFDADDNDLNHLERDSLRVASLLTKSTSV